MTHIIYQLDTPLASQCVRSMRCKLRRIDLIAPITTRHSRASLNGETAIPVDWKSSNRVRFQVGCKIEAFRLFRQFPLQPGISFGNWIGAGEQSGGRQCHEDRGQLGHGLRLGRCDMNWLERGATEVMEKRAACLRSIVADLSYLFEKKSYFECKL